MNAGPGFSLASAPWIDVVDRRGEPAVLSAGAVLERAGEVFLAAPDPLVRSATVRLLTAIAYTAGCAPVSADDYARQVTGGIDLTPAAAWTARHADVLDLLHPERPLFQDGSLRELAGVPEAVLPVLYLDVTAAVNRPLLSDRRSLHASVPVGLRRAAELLLVQQMWAAGGKISGPEEHYGKGRLQGTAAAATGGVIWMPAGTVAEVLAWRVTPAAQTSTAHWTHVPREEPARGKGIMPGGEADALTWQPRRVLLLPEPDTRTVGRVLLARGWRMAPLEPPVAATAAGRDLVDTDEGKKLSALAVTGEMDVAPLLERWWAAPHGSWAHCVRQAIAATGRAPDVVAVALAVNYKQMLYQRQVSLPARLLADPRTAGAADSVMTFRRRSRKAAPGAAPTRAAGTTLPPAFGSDLLATAEFLTASGSEREATLFTLARPAPGGDPARHGERSAILAAAALSPMPSAWGAAARLKPQRPMSGQAGAGGGGGPQDFALSADAAPADREPARPAPSHSSAHPLGPPDDTTVLNVDTEATDGDVLGLFITADSPLDAFPDPEGPVNARPLDPGYDLARRLGRWAANPRTRGVMPALASWAVRPDISNRAYETVTSGLPPEQHQAAMLTAALFAVHYQTRPSAPRYGGTDLPRLMRSYGSAGRFGPRHPHTRVALKLIVRTTSLDALRRQLMPLVRIAASDGKAPHWPGLFRDLTHWNRETRERWAVQFFTRTPPPGYPTDKDAPPA